MEDTHSPHPPAPDGLPLLGNGVGFARDPLTFTTDAVEDVGDVFRIDLPVGDRYVVAHPEYAERVLISERDTFEKTDDFVLAFGNSVVAVDGEDWREQREFLDPFFFASQIQSFLPTMREQVVDRAESWDDGESIATVPEMKALTFDVLATTLLGFDPDSNRGDLRRAADDLNSYFDPVTWALPNWVPTPSGRRFDAAKATLRTELSALLEEATGSDDTPPGTVNLLVGTTRALADGALATLLATAVEAKAATLQQLTGYSGTTTDAVAVGCDPTGTSADFAGSATAVGRATRVCVRDAVRESLDARYPEGDYPDSVADAEHGVLTTERATLFDPKSGQ